MITVIKSPHSALEIRTRHGHNTKETASWLAKVGSGVKKVKEIAEERLVLGINIRFPKVKGINMGYD